jgi:hypothetical protein
MRSLSRRRLNVKLVGNYVDYGAPEFVATTIGEVKRISDDLVRVTYIRRHAEENVAVAHTVYGYRDFVKLTRMLDERCEPLLREMEQWGKEAAAHLN